MFNQYHNPGGCAAKMITRLLVFCCLTGFLFVSQAHAQGSLTPPGAPDAIMKTLDQVEARIPIGQPNYTCSVAGASYYLTTNLTANGGLPVIRIVTNSVTLDLNGFSILGLAGTANGISIYDGCDNVRVHNGTIRDCYNHGIYAHLTRQSTFEGVRFINNGRSSASYNGLNAGMLARVIGCRFEDNGGAGLVLNTNSLAKNCIIDSNTDGLKAVDDCKIEGNTIILNSGNGLLITGSGAYVADNTVRGNGDNYNISAGNQLNLLLCEIPEVLSWPCSVKLAGTLICSATGTNGITVNADNVTIDLAGHTLVGTGSGTGCGIYQPTTNRNLKVFNGSLVNWGGNGSGINVGQFALLTDLHASANDVGFYARQGSVLTRCLASSNTDNGFTLTAYGTVLNCQSLNNLGSGFFLGDGGVIRDCLAAANTNRGISVGDGNTLSGCVADSNAGTGFWIGHACTLSDCSARYNRADGFHSTDANFANCIAVGNLGHGFNSDGGTMSHCSAVVNLSQGIYLGGVGTIQSCTASGNDDDGIYVNTGARVSGCAANVNGLNGNGSGIHIFGHDNLIEDNVAYGSDRGFEVDSAGNFLARNKASGNSTNWVVAAGNICLVVNAATNAAFSGNAGGTAPGSTDPNANFTF